MSKFNRKYQQSFEQFAEIVNKCNVMRKETRMIVIVVAPPFPFLRIHFGGWVSICMYMYISMSECIHHQGVVNKGARWNGNTLLKHLKEINEIPLKNKESILNKHKK